MTEKPIVLGVISDPHFGSLWGLWPKNHRNKDGGSRILNPGQEYLSECWQDFQTWLPPKLDVLMVAGDASDGDGRKDAGIYQVTPDVDEQVDAGVEALGPLAARADLLYVVDGTRYHGWPRDAKTLAQKLGAVQHPVGSYAPPVWSIEVGGVYIELWHKLSDAQIYTAQAMQRETMFSRTVAEAKGFSTDLIIVGHWHSYRAYEDGAMTVLTVPCWELQTPWAQAKPNLWMPNIGGLVVYLYPDNRGKGMRLIDWEKRIYPLPKREVSHIAITGTGKKRKLTTT